MAQSNILKTIDLKKSFVTSETTVEVLKGINVSVEQGEFAIIFGPSGCGKSTLLHSLLGLEVPTSGKVIMDNQDIYSMTEDERAMYRRRNVSIIYQQPLWVHSLNVVQNVVFPLKLLNMEKNLAQEQAIKLLTQVGLEHWANYSPTELSSGQQQKISLARSLMNDPKLIVADEPTGNMDTISGQELLNTFISLVKSGKSIVMVTHDLEYLKYASKVFHMIDGQVVEEYTPKNIHKLKKIAGKETVEDASGAINVRDPKLLEKLQV